MVNQPGHARWLLGAGPIGQKSIGIADTGRIQVNGPLSPRRLVGILHNDTSLTMFSLVF